eukprot:1332568-Prorocentrum_lima.AAC.1
MPEVKALLSSMLWPHMPWVREVLVELAEEGWTAVPERLRRCLLEYATGWGNTHISEQVWHDLKDKQNR